MWNRQDEKGVVRIWLHLAERQNDQSWESWITWAVLEMLWWGYVHETEVHLKNRGTSWASSESRWYHRLNALAGADVRLLLIIESTHRLFGQQEANARSVCGLLEILQRQINEESTPSLNPRTTFTLCPTAAAAGMPRQFQSTQWRLQSMSTHADRTILSICCCLQRSPTADKIHRMC